MKPGYEITASNIKLLRGRQSQEDFARRFGTNQKTVSAWERGLNKPRGEKLFDIALTFGISPKDLLNKKLRQVNGKIINIEKEGQLRNARAELKRVIKDFEAEMLRFLHAMQTFAERLDNIEKKKAS